MLYPHPIKNPHTVPKKVYNSFESIAIIDELLLSHPTMLQIKYVNIPPTIHPTNEYTTSGIIPVMI
jgi:hypothetical protein